MTTQSGNLRVAASRSGEAPSPPDVALAKDGERSTLSWIQRIPALELVAPLGVMSLDDEPRLRQRLRGLLCRCLNQ